jgi:hypothetical protein
VPAQAEAKVTLADQIQAWIDTMTINAFADLHHLDMLVQEQGRADTPSVRWHARFKDCVTIIGTGHFTAVGKGATPEDAINRYREAIAGETLRTRDGTLIQVPTDLLPVVIEAEARPAAPEPAPMPEPEAESEPAPRKRRAKA